MLIYTASITFGEYSSDGNGYREHLKQLLGPANVQYIGTQCSGNMQNGNSEGHSGYLISQMWGVVQPDLPQRPNVILIYVGTNDMLYPVQPDTAPQRLATLVQQLSTRLPNALIVVGNLFIETDPAVQARIDKFNAALPGVIAPLQKKGANVVIADFSHALTKSDLHCDGEHPDDVGYAKMAEVFFGSMLKAEIGGKIHGPFPGSGNGTVCKPEKPTAVPTCTTSVSSTKHSTSTKSSATSTKSTHPDTTKAPAV